MKDQNSLKISGSQSVVFEKQFKSSIVSFESFAVTPIEYIGHNGDILDIHATGFVYQKNNEYFLVTALHCLTGKNVFNGKYISPSGFEPFRIAVQPTEILSEGQNQRIRLEMEITDSEDNALWLKDPNLDYFKTDIGIVKLPNLNNRKYVSFNSYHEKDSLAATGSECIVVGYPLRSDYKPYLPIWRRGSFATEPDIPLDNKPVFLIDDQTSKGMSGSPVIQRTFGPLAKLVEGEWHIEPDNVVSSRLIGVYGGRAHDKDDIGPIGYAWYANRIDRIIDQSPMENIHNITGKLEGKL
jgi:hypothetical protein